MKAFAIILSKPKNLYTVLTGLLLIFSLPAFSTPKPVINLIEEEKKLNQQLNDDSENDADADGAGVSVAQAATEDSYDSLYKIELLIFAYVNTGDENSEIWRNPERPDFSSFHPPYLPQDTDTQSAEQIDHAQDLDKKDAAGKYVFLDINDPNVNEFSDIIRKMMINGHYRILQHLAWKQKVLEETDNDYFYLEGGNHYPSFEDIQAEKQQSQLSNRTIDTGDESQNQSETQQQIGESELAGTIKIYRSRYLHIQTDLWFTTFTINDAGMCYPDGSETALNNSESLDNQSASYTALTNFHLDQHRRLRSGELHYLDHPRFGLLIKFTSIDKPEEQTDSTESDNVINTDN